MFLSKLFSKKPRRQLASAKLPPISFDKLPDDIAKTLRATSKRIRGIVKLRGALAVFAALLISILSIMAIDAMITIFSSWVRWTLWSIGLASGVITAWQTLIRPLSKPFTPGRIAAFIEAQHPELEERLSTVVEILSSPGGADEGTAQLLRVLTEAAVTDAKNLSPRKEFTTRTVKPKFIAVACALGILGTLFAFWPKEIAQLLLSSTVPTYNGGSLYDRHISVLPEDKIILRGSSVPINVAVESGWQDVRVDIYTRKPGQSDTKAVSERLIQSSRDKTEEDVLRRFYTHTIFTPQETVEYRIKCGQAFTRWYTITVVPPPVIKEWEIKKFFPQYTGMEPVTNKTGELFIEGVVGTKIQITAIPERDLSPRFMLRTNEISQALGSDKKRYIYTFDLQEKMPSAWRLELFDKYGFSNTNSLPWFDVRCVKDQPPRIFVRAPQRYSYTTNPYSKLDFIVASDDDFKVDRIELRYKIDADANAPLSASADTPYKFSHNINLEYVNTNRFWKWESVDFIDLNRLKVKDGQRLSVQLVALDNLPPELGGPQAAFATPFTFIIDKNADSPNKINLEDEYNSLKDSTDKIQQFLEAALAAAKEGKDQIDSRKDDPAAVTQVVESHRNIKLADNEVRRMLANTESSHFERLIPDMRRLLERNIQPADKQAVKTLAAEQIHRRREIIELIRLLEKAIEKTEELSADIDSVNDIQQKIEDAKSLIDKEEALANDAPDKDPDEFKNEQQDIKDEFEQMTREIPNPMEKVIEKVNEIRDKIEELRTKQDNLKDILDDLQSDDEDTRDNAEKRLEELTPDMPEDSTDNERIEEVEREIKIDAESLKENIQDVSDNVKNAAPPEMTADSTDKLDSAADHMQDAQDNATDAADDIADDKKDEAGEKMEDAEQDMKAASDDLRDAMENLRELGEQIKAQMEQDRMDALQAMQDAMDHAGEPPPPEDGEGEGEPPPPQPGMQQAQQDAKNAAEKMKQFANQMAKNQGMPKPDKPMPGPPMPLPIPGEKPEKFDFNRLPNMPDPASAIRVNRTRTSYDALFKDYGGLSSTIDDQDKDMPPEYKELIKAYFLELSKGQE